MQRCASPSRPLAGATDLRGHARGSSVAVRVTCLAAVLLALGGSGHFIACASDTVEPQLTDEPCDAEDTTESCYPGPPSTRSIGLCTDGSRRCTQGRWTVCQDAVLPTGEACDNGLDDDCDGAADEACPCAEGELRDCYAGPAATRGVGVCSAGVQPCDGESWSTSCDGQVLPTEEICNGADDDCNGAPDDCGQQGGCPGCNEASYCDAGGCSSYACAWVLGAWSACSAPCGPGTQTRTIQCICDGDILVADAFCTSPAEPTSQPCDLGPCCDNSCPSHDACGTNDCGNSCGPTCPPHGSYSTTCRENRCVWEIGCETSLPCTTTCYWGESTCVGTSEGSCSECVDPDNQRCYCWPNE